MGLRERAEGILTRLKASPPAHWSELLVAALGVIQAEERTRFVVALRNHDYICRHLRKDGCDECAASHFRRISERASVSPAEVLETVMGVVSTADDNAEAAEVLAEVQSLLEEFGCSPESGGSSADAAIESTE